MQLRDILFSQGFGSRRECAALVALGHVAVAGRICDDPGEELAQLNLEFQVRGEVWPYHAKALVMLHKPPGHECSQKPHHHPSVLRLLPAPLRQRGIQPIGRLDEDTTGLLLLTDDGALIHKLTSPKHLVPKVYEVGTRHPVLPQQIEQLLAGVVLDDSPAPVRAAAAAITAPCALRLTLTTGKYHQVKRMVAAVGNRVEHLHRSSFGDLLLPSDLAPGQWRWLHSADVISH